MNNKTKIILFLGLLFFQSFLCQAEWELIKWQFPSINLSSNTEEALSPQVAINNTGNAISIWERFNGTSWVIQTKRYDTRNEIWLPTENLSTSTQDAHSPQITMNNSENAIAI